MKSWRLVMSACVVVLAMTGCGDDGDDGMTPTDAGMGGVDSGGGGDTDAGGGETDAGMAMDDAGGGDTDAGGGDTDAGGGDTDAGGGAATWTQVYAILAGSCSPCHTGGASGGLAMPNAATAYDNLVNVPSACDRDRVEPGDSAASHLYVKLTAPDCGAQMPLGRSPLSEEDIATIAAWIDAGAMEN